MSTAIYAFSGDPITYGHLDIIDRAAKVFDRVIVAIGINIEKEYLFSLAERTKLATDATNYLTNVSVVSFQGLLVDFAYEVGAQVIIKGVRNPTDFEYESHLCHLGDTQAVGIDTFILVARQDLAHISSSSVKQIQKDQGLIHEYVPLNVKQSLEAKLSGQYIIGVTGEIGAGKSYISQKFVEFGQQQGIEVHNIELDLLTHQIYQELQEPAYLQLRTTLAETFGQEILNPDRTVNRQKLGEIVFNDFAKLTQLNQIMAKPILVRIRRSLFQKKGLILLNASLLVETKMTYLSNNHLCLVKTDHQSQRQRLFDRQLGEAQINRRLASQYTFDQKKKKLQEIIDQDNFGQIWEIDNSAPVDEAKLEKVFKQVVTYFKLANHD